MENQILLDNETMYLNMHTIVFPDTKHDIEKIKTIAQKNNAVAHYSVQALINVIFTNKEDAMSFYTELNA